MPYTKPPAKTRKLSPSKRRKWVKVFNAAYAHTPAGRDKEEYAHRVAWSKVKGRSRKRRTGVRKKRWYE